MTDVTIVIPTYNESENIPELVQRIHASCNGVRILVVDDSPNLLTQQVAEKWGCKVYHRYSKKGLSSAIIDGIEQADTSKVIVMDADLQHPPEVLPQMIDALDDYGLVIGSRWVKGGGVKDWSFKRVLVSKVANALAFLVAPRIKDRTSGFFGVRKECVDTSKLSSVGWKTALEIMAKGNYKSAKEVPFIFVPRTKGDSKFNVKQIREYLKQLIPLYFTCPIVKFATVGASGAILSLLTMYLFVDVAHIYYLLAYALSFILVVSSNFIWHSLWTFRQKAKVVNWFKYACISAIALGINEGLLYLLTGKLGLHYLLSTIIGMFTAFLINWTLSRRIVWKKQTQFQPKIAMWQ